MNGTNYEILHYAVFSTPHSSSASYTLKSTPAVRPVIASNAIPFLQMRSVRWHSTSVREMEGKKERRGEEIPISLKHMTTLTLKLNKVSGILVEVEIGIHAVTFEVRQLLQVDDTLHRIKRICEVLLNNKATLLHTMDTPLHRCKPRMFVSWLFLKFRLSRTRGFSTDCNCCGWSHCYALVTLFNSLKLL